MTAGWSTGRFVNCSLFSFRSNSKGPVPKESLATGESERSMLPSQSLPGVYQIGEV